MVKLILSLLLLASEPLLCQHAAIPNGIVSEIEKQVSGSEKSFEKEDFSGKLNLYSRQPLNLNRADEEDLRSLVVLSNEQIENFIKYRSLFGSLIDKYEMQAIPGWDLETINKILPFVKTSIAISSSPNWKEYLKNAEHEFLIKYSRGKPPDDADKYTGSPDRLFFRYRYHFSNSLQAQWLGEKDAGETFFKGANRQGFDFNSFHLALKGSKLIRSIIIGDFTVNMGQGLTQWQGISLSKSTDITSVKRESPVSRPYTSSGEVNFCRGIATSLQKGNSNLNFFISFRKIGGSLDYDTINESGFLTSFNSSGYHRTLKEISQKNNIRDFSGGASIINKSKLGDVSFNFVYHQLSHALRKQDQPYNLFSARGKTFLNSSVEYSRNFKRMHFFCEAAIDRDLNPAVLFGTMLALTPTFDAGFVCRSYSTSYSALFAGAFGENELPSNEQGVYAGFTFRPGPAITIQSYIDHFYFPWLKYRVNAPSYGKEFVLLCKYQPDKINSLSVRIRADSRMINDDGHSSIRKMVQRSRSSFQLHWENKISNTLQLSHRLETVVVKQDQQPGNTGFLIFSELAFHSRKTGLSGNCRIQYFDTDNYDSRIYAYENVMSNSFGFPAYYSSGFRTYLNVRKNLSGLFVNKETDTDLNFWFRLSATIQGRNISVNDRLTNTHDMQFQLMLSF